MQIQFLHTAHCVVCNNFIINSGICTYFVHYKYMNHNRENVSRYDYVYQATNYWYEWKILNNLTSKIELISFTIT